MYREVIRATEPFVIEWGEQYRCVPFDLSEKRPLGEMIVQCEDFNFFPLKGNGSSRTAQRYIQRLFDIHRDEPYFPDAVEASTLVYGTAEERLVAFCLLGGGKTRQEIGIYNAAVLPAYRRQGICTRMVLRALTILSIHGIPQLSFWREDDSAAAALALRIGFHETGSSRSGNPISQVGPG